MCPCNTAPLTSEELLQHCPLQDTLLKATWSQNLEMMKKLHRDLAALKEDSSVCEKSQGF